MGTIQSAIRVAERAIKEAVTGEEAKAAAAKKAAELKAITDEASAPIGKSSSANGSLTRYKSVSPFETEIKGNLAGFKKGGMVSSSARGQGAVIRKKKAARIC